MKKLFLLMLVTMVVGCSKSDSTDTKTQAGIALGHDGDSITIINSKTGKPLPFERCGGKDIKNRCRINIEEFRRLAQVTIVFSEKKGNSVDCCITYHVDGNEFNYCRTFPDPATECPPPPPPWWEKP